MPQGCQLVTQGRGLELGELPTLQTIAKPHCKGQGFDHARPQCFTLTHTYVHIHNNLTFSSNFSAQHSCQTTKGSSS